ncbi:YjbE family integral membrane protein [Hephaestia caeni]|uniref:YjbE family integral membrane protein n=1 Tax=Hephaestia caeni TaxID=645617 RepID=A0A397PB20_9SPHN|nr:YjbE family putative metal transport protein [Hephaestia caeni]RIA44405.1 YjbE family integral membrane protein [Hephaestia caeni]
MPVLSIADVFTSAGLATLGQVIMIDLMLAGDNIVVLGTLAAGLPPRERKRVLGLGVGIALVCLVGFAFLATTLLHVVGLLFAGGLLLLWVGWKLFREIHPPKVAAPVDDPDTPAIEGGKPAKSFARAAIQVAIADLSMSLDNVLAVAGAARDHPTVLFFGLALSVTLMAVAANLIARIIERYHWIAYIGLAVILYVAGSMIFDGWVDPEIGVGHLFRAWI